MHESGAGLRAGSRIYRLNSCCFFCYNLRMILINTFHTDEHDREIVPMTSPGFPYACFMTDISHYTDRTVAWHWHTALEFSYVIEGELTIETPDFKETLSAGSFVFVNTGVLHTYHAEGQSPCHMYAHLFDMHLLSGSYGSVFEEKYMLPVCNSTLQAYVIRPDSIRRVRMVSSFLETVEIMRDEPEGHEFLIRENLSRMWLDLLAETEEVRAAVSMKNNADTDRIKQMMTYIDEHYGEAITAQDIADAAGISVRESSRCFNRSIGATPLAYLTGHRIKMACRMLASTQMTVIEVSEECGFSSPSYFTKVFHDLVGETPKSYQMKRRAQSAALSGS